MFNLNIRFIFWLWLLTMPAVYGNETNLIILIDNSGSMKQHDPQLFIQRIIQSFTSQINSNLALITFDQDVNILLPLSVSKPSQTKIEEALQQINYNGLRTDIARAVERAIYLLKNESNSRTPNAILLLTDGYMDTGNETQNREKTKWLLSELAEECIYNRIRIFGIAFTNDADYQLLQSLAWRTRGDYFRVFDSEMMYNAFHQIQEQLYPSVPLAKTMVEQNNIPNNTSNVTPIIKIKTVDTIKNDSPSAATPILGGLAAQDDTIRSSPPAVALNEHITIGTTNAQSTKNSTSINTSISTNIPPDTPPDTPQDNIEVVTEINEVNYKIGVFLFFMTMVIIMLEKKHSISAFFKKLIQWPKVAPNTKNEIESRSNLVSNQNNNILYQTVKFDAPPQIHQVNVINSTDIQALTILAKLVDRQDIHTEFPLTHATTLISRSERWQQSNVAHLHINSPTISRRHAVIEFRNFSFWLRDLGSTNGTYINYRQIKEGEVIELKNNDFIQFHNFGFDFIQDYNRENPAGDEQK